MKQFDVYRLPGTEQLVCRIQSELGRETPYILCAPLYLADDIGVPEARLFVPVNVNDHLYYIATSEMIALPGYDLNDIIGTTLSVRDEIIRAVDILVLGF